MHHFRRWQRDIPHFSMSVALNLNSLSPFKLPIKMITLASRWSFSPLIYILRNWLKVEVFEAALLQICCSSCAESQLYFVMTWCWSEHQQQQHPRVVFGNWIQFCFNYFWIVISEDEPGNVFTIGNVCSFPKQRKYVRIWCEVIRTEHFCFKTYLDRSCCGLAEWKAVMLDWRLQQPHFITQLWQQQAAGGN